MRSTRIIGILAIIVGAGLLVFANVIADRIEEGRQEINAGQKKIDTTQKVFGIGNNPVAKQVGQSVTSSGQRRINEGQAQITTYSQLVQYFRIGGGVLIVIGIFLLFYGKKKRLR